MSDQEWERWKATFQKGERPMPDVVKRVIGRARRDRTSALVGLGALYVILAATMGSRVPALRHASTPAEVADFVAGLLGAVAIVVAVHVTMRGTFRGTGAAPLEALAALERRHAGRLRLMRVIPWIGVCGAAAGVAPRVMTEGFTHRVVEPLALTVAALVLWAFVWLRMRPRIDRDLRDVGEARRLLGEVGDEVSEGRE